MAKTENVNGTALHLQPISHKEAALFIKQHHRHHPPQKGWKFGIAVNDGVRVVGVCVVARPVARLLDDGWTVEVTRCCTDGTKNACSKLYAAAWRAARAMGYKRIITYTLASERGNSLRAAGWQVLHKTKGGTWNRRGRPRVDHAPTEPKLLWQVTYA